MTTRTRRPAEATPWDDGAWERCPFCEQVYAYELEVRCADCDGPLCPFCTVTVRERLEVTCPHCPEEP